MASISKATSTIVAKALKPSDKGQGMSGKSWSTLARSVRRKVLRRCLVRPIVIKRTSKKG